MGGGQECCCQPADDISHLLLPLLACCRTTPLFFRGTSFHTEIVVDVRPLCWVDRSDVLLEPQDFSLSSFVQTFPQDPSRNKSAVRYLCAVLSPSRAVQAAVEGIAPALLLGSHVSLYIFWTCIATLNVVLHHSGYDFEPYLLDSLWPFKSMTQQHDYHHFAFDRCFGVIGICDWLHGTDGGFKDHLALWKQAQT